MSAKLNSILTELAGAESTGALLDIKQEFAQLTAREQVLAQARLNERFDVIARPVRLGRPVRCRTRFSRS